MTPTISLVAYEARDPRKAFVKVPNQRGRWVLVDRCVIEVACAECGSAIGEPCRSKCSAGRHDYMVDTHYVRRKKWMFNRPHWAVDKPSADAGEKPRIRTKPATYKEVKPSQCTMYSVCPLRNCDYCEDRP